jgi:hypothetical protein
VNPIAVADALADVLRADATRLVAVRLAMTFFFFLVDPADFFRVSAALDARTVAYCGPAVIVACGNKIATRIGSSTV